MQIMRKIHAVSPNITLPAKSSEVTYKNRLKGVCILLSPTYGLDDCPQSLQQLPQGHLFCLHPQDHPPEGQWKTSCPANRHFYSRKRQLACFSKSTSESRGWGRRWERRTIATADPAKQERRRRKVDQPRMWRRRCCLVWFMEAGGENSVRLLSCLGGNGGFRVWRDAAEADEGMMLMKMLRRWQPPDAPMGPRDARNAGGERWWSSREPHSHIHASASAHMMVQTCVELADRGGGDVKVRTAVVTQQQIIQEWHLV